MLTSLLVLLVKFYVTSIYLSLVDMLLVFRDTR